MTLHIREDAKKRALLLHYAASDVYDVSDSLPDYDTATQKLQAYFCLKMNTEYEIYVFRQARQNDDETPGGQKAHALGCCLVAPQMHHIQNESKPNNCVQSLLSSSQSHTRKRT